MNPKSFICSVVVAIAAVGTSAQERAQSTNDDQAGLHGDHSDPHRNHGASFKGKPDDRAGDRIGRLPIAVDGKSAPSRVPDEIAYRHFILTLATRDDAPAAARGRQRDHLRPVGLSAADTASLEIALKTVRERLEAIRAQRQALGAAPNPEAIATLRQQEADVITGARLRIQAFLSPQGLSQFERHLRDHVKNKIVIYGDPLP